MYFMPMQTHWNIITVVLTIGTGLPITIAFNNTFFVNKLDTVVCLQIMNVTALLG